MSETRAGCTAIVSVHDVMPETLPDVLDILNRLDRLNVPPSILLIVPGKPWSADGLKTLASLQHAGHELAGHGWSHSVTGISTIYHRLHSRLISRHAAEHLSRDSHAILALITRCHRWFVNAGLRAPTLYVPPAWAMGRVPRVRLRSLPFARYEYTSGIYDARADRFHRLPLAGFEADSQARARPLRAWNTANLALARATRRPLRIAIHPHDLRLKLADDIERLLKSCTRFQDYC
ncbi:MAG: DUF2334 domain-containing protein [Gammaproteobacteria bacterium]|nr:DUF2334 domain-containing protein [Gammaproteobacteria bacterium]